MNKSADRENDRMKALFGRFEVPLLQFATRITATAIMPVTRRFIRWWARRKR
jgi:hypothetical protein